MANEDQIAVKKRLIYAEDLFEPVDFTVLQVRKGGPGGGKTMAMYEQLFRKRVELAPTVDAVEVVRCKECVFYKETEDWDGNKYFACHKRAAVLIMQMKPDDFCSYGERRTDNA